MGQPELTCACHGEATTLALAGALASGLATAAARRALVVYLQGPLGAGKTTLARGMLRELGVRGAVRSPTFTLVETYSCGELEVLHIDLYRIEAPADIHSLGLRDFDRPGVVWLVEWPEKGQGYLPPAGLVVRLDHEGTGRRVSLRAPGEHARMLLQGPKIAALCQAS